MTIETVKVQNIEAWLKTQHLWWVNIHGGMYQRVGIPDLLICKDGHLYGLEAKRGPGIEARPRQKFEMARMNRMGGATTGVVSSLDEVQRIIEKGR